ncbi:hypothetical protein K435DRAFT_810723 [Dendrothele bispora CBS 962.96]|uniref:Uncharacterized protein n=1 Tax=Dendrothele bispora (strain CBS 962.96) TaxID=1314807 RepID=A0A4S8KU88_DENBC|nr:hypothetical protein K435DRAFT_810723 [Dendrothele bispora CBS 962.96]
MESQKLKLFITPPIDSSIFLNMIQYKFIHHPVPLRHPKSDLGSLDRQSSTLSPLVSTQPSDPSRTGARTLTAMSASLTQPDGPILSDASSKPNHTPVIAGSVIAGTLVILSILLLFWRYKKKSRLRLPFTSGLQDNSKASKKATHKVEPYDLKHMSIHHASPVHPHSVIDSNEESTVVNSPRNSVTSIITTSVLTERQIQLRDETEALREQMKILQQAMLSSNGHVCLQCPQEVYHLVAHFQVAVSLNPCHRNIEREDIYVPDGPTDTHMDVLLDLPSGDDGLRKKKFTLSRQSGKQQNIIIIYSDVQPAYNYNEKDHVVTA